jgi:hypothetical protein
MGMIARRKILRGLRAEPFKKFISLLPLFTRQLDVTLTIKENAFP